MNSRCAVIGLFVFWVGICGDIRGAAASAFDPAQVVQLLKREIRAAVITADTGSPRLKVEEAVLDLDLVEITGKAGSRLMVPGADFGTGKDELAKGGLRRRLVVDLASERGTKPEISQESEMVSNGPLASLLADLRSNLRPAVDAPPALDLKKLSVELEFVLERDGKEGLRPVVFSAGRPVDPKNVQKLKLRLSLPD